MRLTLNKTKNNTLIIDYAPEKQRQDLLNEIWREREDYLNKNFNRVSEQILIDTIMDNGSFLDNYDRETHRMQEKACYATYINFISLINELKALTPIYNGYTIVNFKCKGMSYDFQKDERCSMSPTTDIGMLDTHDELIAEPFLNLIRFLKGYEKTCRDYYIYKFHAELLPNKIKSKRRKTNVPRGMRHEVFKRDNYTCCECGASKEDGAKLHIDHIIPVSKGGTDELSNLQTLCADCNLNKSNIIQGGK